MASTKPSRNQGNQPRQEVESDLVSKSGPAITSTGGVLTGVQILAVGAYAPENIVRNEDLAELGYDADWIVQRTGIRERRRAADDQDTSDMALAAALVCLERAEVKPEQLDLILLATMTPDMPTPSTACHLQRKLGAKSAAAIDMNAACAGFMYALVTGMQFIKTGACRRVLVVGADMMSRTVDPQDKKTFPLFGDGAGCVLLGAGSSEQGLLSFTLGADGEGADLLCQPAGGTSRPITTDVLANRQQFITMEGRAVFKWAVRLLADASQEVIQQAGLKPDDLALLVLHQANSRIIDAAVGNLGVDPEKVLVNLDRYGNTSAASMPLVLEDAHQQGRLQRGDHLLLCGFGAGLTWGAGVMRW